MIPAFYNEERIEVFGETVTLVLNFKALDAAEGLLGRSFSLILGDLLTDDPPDALQAKVLWGLLREKHADLTMDQIATLLRGDEGVKVGVAIASLIKRAFPLTKGGEADAKPNPRKPRGTSATS